MRHLNDALYIQLVAICCYYYRFHCNSCHHGGVIFSTKNANSFLKIVLHEPIYKLQRKYIYKSLADDGIQFEEEEEQEEKGESENELNEEEKENENEKEKCEKTHTLSYLCHEIIYSNYDKDYISSLPPLLKKSVTNYFKQRKAEKLQEARNLYWDNYC